jgi:hypothetical protein
VSGKGKGATLQEDEKMQRWQELDMWGRENRPECMQTQIGINDRKESTLKVTVRSWIYYQPMGSHWNTLGNKITWSNLYFTRTHKEEILEGIIEKFIEKILDMFSQNVQDALKKFQDTENKV